MEKYMSGGLVDIDKLESTYSTGEIDLCSLLKILLDDSLDFLKSDSEPLKWSNPHFIHENIHEISKCKRVDAFDVIELILCGYVSWLREWIHGGYLHEPCIYLLKQLGSSDAKRILKLYLQNCNNELFHSLDGDLVTTYWGALEKGFEAAAELGISGLEVLFEPYLDFHSHVGPLVIAKALVIMNPDSAFEKLAPLLFYTSKRNRVRIQVNIDIFNFLEKLDKKKLIERVDYLHKRHEFPEEDYEWVIRRLGLELPLEIYMDDNLQQIDKKMQQMKIKNREHAMRIALSYIHEKGLRSVEWLKKHFDFDRILSFGLSQIENDLVSVITACSILSKFPDQTFKFQLEKVVQTIPQYYPPLVALIEIADRDSMNAVFEWVCFQMKNNSFGKDWYDENPLRSLLTNRDGSRYEFDSAILNPVSPYAGLSRAVDFFNSIPAEVIQFLESKLIEGDNISKASSILLLGFLFTLKSSRTLMTKDRYQVISSRLLEGPKCEDILDYLRNHEGELDDDVEKQSFVSKIPEYESILDFIRESNEWEYMDGYDDFESLAFPMFKILAETALDLSQDEGFPLG